MPIVGGPLNALSAAAMLSSFSGWSVSLWGALYLGIPLLGWLAGALVGRGVDALLG
ncbi:MAG: hypothetical protein QNK03_06700 [Myxococcota bacterium]|nr:hypothetical protein [Myxococcota bacterium]